MLIKLLLAIGLSVVMMSSNAQVRVTQTVKLGDTVSLLTNTAFDKYITRGSFCSLILDRFLFSETLPGSFMVDLSLKFNSDTQEARTLRVLFDDVIQVSQAGEPISLKLSNHFLATQIPLTNVTDIDIAVRLIPIVDTKYSDAYSLIGPLLSKPAYGIDIGNVFDKFASIASAGDKRTSLMFRATIPVPQNIVEAQHIEGLVSSNRLMLFNNQLYGITLEGSREVTDPSIVGKAKDFLNGISTFVSGKAAIERPSSSFRGSVALRFTKDLTQALPETVIQQLKELSDASDQAYSKEAITQVGVKASDAIKAIEALSKSKHIDQRADFHLRSYIDMTRIWAQYKYAGETDLKTAEQWRNQFFDWYDRANLRGVPHLTQAYGISEIYGQKRLAKILIPYSLTDEMTIELVQRQLSIHQALARIGEQRKSEAI